jgi:tRNA(Ile)-lysidine synthase
MGRLLADMTTTPPVDLLIAAVNAQIGRVGPGRYGVACSGGGDSLALAHAAIRAAGPGNVVVLSIDHGLTAEAAAASIAVVAWARGMGATAQLRRVELARRSSLEAAARTARYAALDELADELGLACVMLGHTARDQAETVMMRVLRGTGPAGLAAIPSRRGRFVRPLLALDRAAIDAYVHAHQLPVWSDPMNADRRLARVRVREEILPALRRENPQLDAALVRLAGSAAEWLEVIDAKARPLAQFPIDAAVLAAEPAAIRKRAIAIALDAAGLDYDALHLERIDELATARARGQRTVEVAGAAIIRSYGVLSIAPRGNSRESAAAPPIAVPVGHELRRWHAGDRMRPVRLKGRSRKLSDLYIDAKLPRSVRDVARVLVRTSDATIVWAEHLGDAYGEPFFEPAKPPRSGGKF